MNSLFPFTRISTSFRYSMTSTSTFHCSAGCYGYGILSSGKFPELGLFNSLQFLECLEDKHMTLSPLLVCSHRIVWREILNHLQWEVICKLLTHHVTNYYMKDHQGVSVMVSTQKPSYVSVVYVVVNQILSTGWKYPFNPPYCEWLFYLILSSNSKLRFSLISLTSYNHLDNVIKNLGSGFLFVKPPLREEDNIVLTVREVGRWVGGGQSKPSR